MEVRLGRVRISIQYTKNMDLRMSIIDDDHEVDRILESMNLDEYKLINLPMEQPGDSSHEHTAIGIAPTLDTGSTSGLARCEGSSMVLHLGVDPCQGSSPR